LEIGYEIYDMSINFTKNKLWISYQFIAITLKNLKD
jgi:hypothetical protein